MENCSSYAKVRHGNSSAQNAVTPFLSSDTSMRSSTSSITSSGALSGGAKATPSAELVSSEDLRAVISGAPDRIHDMNVALSQATVDPPREALYSSSTVDLSIRAPHYIPSNFIPESRSRIDENWARSMWGHARHFDMSLPEEFPESEESSQEYVKKYIHILKSVHSFTCQTIERELLRHLHKLCVDMGLVHQSDLKDLKKTDQVHRLVLSSSNVFTTEYLRNCLTILKAPQKISVRWLDAASKAIRTKYKFDFVPPCVKKGDFIEKIARSHNDSFNQRLRRGMLRNVRAVWYDRLPTTTRLKTLFGDKSTSTKSEEFVVIVPTDYGHTVKIHGYVVSIESSNLHELGSGESSVAHATMQALNHSSTQEDFQKRMGQTWEERNDKGGGGEVSYYNVN